MLLALSAAFSSLSESWMYKRGGCRCESFTIQSHSVSCACFLLFCWNLWSFSGGLRPFTPHMTPSHPQTWFSLTQVMSFFSILSSRNWQYVNQAQFACSSTSQHTLQMAEFKANIRTFFIVCSNPKLDTLLIMMDRHYTIFTANTHCRTSLKWPLFCNNCSNVHFSV